MKLKRIEEGSRAQISTAPAHRSRRPGGAASPKRMGIERALQWAFGTECAQLDFDEVGTLSGRALPVCGNEQRILEQHRLGCRVDGGGRSEPHLDAVIVAQAVSALPVALGGPRMALRIADLARAGLREDWMPGARTRIVPKNWSQNQHGRQAATIDARQLGPEGFGPTARRNRKGAIVYDAARCCPVAYVNGPDRIARARRSYLLWCGALLDLRAQLANPASRLACIRLTGDLPPLRPWLSDAQKTVDAEICPP